jgi:GH25 family lysozyme M1 (1,4-beta-N-acetylmuramidase)
MRSVVAAGSVAIFLASGASVAGAAVSASPGVPAHPDGDYMGSTLGRSTVGVAAPRVLASGSVPGAVAAGSAATTPGLDVSHYQGAISWGSVAAQGARFAYMKATESTTYVDPQFSANYAGSAGAGLLRGAYHFALPDLSSGAAQAMFFLGNGGGWVGDGRTLPPVLDIEYNPYGTADWAGWCYGLSAAQMSAWISDFAATIHARTNRWPVIYTTNGWWNHCTANNPGFANDPLWIASTITMPASWTDYTFDQTATSGTFPGDQDVFNGSVTDLQTLATGTEPDKIVEHYNALGGASSYLGTPTGREYPLAGGWAQNYQSGIIGYYPPNGAYAVHGAIWQHYQQLGGPGGGLGLPITDESGTPDRIGRYNHFNGAQGASIYWTPATGAQSIHGDIRRTWASLGWERGRLGYPASDEFAVAGGRRNNLQHGTITWFSADSTTQVAYN